MTDPSLTLFWQTLELSDPDTPLYRQLYDAVRKAVLAGTLASSTRIPATRTLARHLNVSRNTVLEAFEQLFAEGYLETQQGKGTFVAEGIAVLSESVTRNVAATLEPPKLATRGTLLAQSSLARCKTKCARSRFKPDCQHLNIFLGNCGHASPPKPPNS